MKYVIGLMLFGLFSQAFAAYNAVERLKLIEDRLKLQEFLRPMGHDFLLDSSVTIGGDFQDLYSDITDLQSAADAGGGASTSQFNSLTNKWSGREFSGSFTFDGGIPLVSFTAWGAKITPEILRFQLGASMNVGILSETLSASDIAAFLPDSIPNELRTVIAALDFSQATAGQDLLDFVDAQDTPSNDIIDDNLLAVLKSQYGGLVTLNQAVLDALSGGNKIPNADIYMKVEAKIGPRFAFEKGKLFGDISVYALGRLDYNFLISSSNVENMQNSLEVPQDIEEWNMALDLSLGFRKDNYSLLANISELKVANLSEAENANLQYENPMLIRLHGEAMYKPYGFLKLRPFVGFHMRDGYGVGDGYYLGADAMAHVWKERLALQVRTQIDPDHLTLSPRLKFWILQLEGMVKTPIADERDGVEIAPQYSVNLRIFI